MGSGSKVVQSVIDVGQSQAMILSAQRQGSRDFEVLSFHKIPAEGFANGLIGNLSEAAETIYKLIKLNQKSIGSPITKLSVNFNEASTNSWISKGTSFVSGEGQIRSSDMAQCLDSANRNLRFYNQTIVYSKADHYVVDDKDWVSDPAGIFGGKLDLFLRVITCDFKPVQQWREVALRLYLDDLNLSHNGVSVYYGVCGYRHLEDKMLLIDAGLDWNTYVYARMGIVEDICVMPAFFEQAALRDQVLNVSSKWLGSREYDNVYITGDTAEAGEWSDIFKEYFDTDKQPHVVSGQGLPTAYKDPSYCAMAGTLWRESLVKKQGLLAKAEAVSPVRVKSKFKQFVEDYF